MRQNVGILTYADRCSLFLVGGDQTTDSQYLVSNLFDVSSNSTVEEVQSSHQHFLLGYNSTEERTCYNGASKWAQISCCDTIYTIYSSVHKHLIRIPNPFRGTHCISATIWQVIFCAIILADYSLYLKMIFF